MTRYSRTTLLIFAAAALAVLAMVPVTFIVNA
jgi:hypothetical protein